LIAELRIDREWAIVVRGEAELDPAGFDNRRVLLGPGASPPRGTVRSERRA
jgi:hypothetical protein